jgi:hypothetical protein
VGRRVKTINEPGVPTDRSSNPKRVILGEFEGLKVIEDHWFFESTTQVMQGARLQKHGMTPETGADPGDGVGRAVQRACDLSQCRAGDQGGGDRAQQLGPLAVVGDSERLTRECATAGAAAKTWNSPPLRS